MTLLAAATLQFGQSPEVWSFTLTNLLTLGLGSALTLVAFEAYRREGLATFRTATVGFGLITLGTVVEMAYELLFNDVLDGGVGAVGRELFLLRSVEGALIAAGFVLLFLSLRQAS